MKMKKSLKRRIGCTVLCMTTALSLVAATGCSKKETSKDNDANEINSSTSESLNTGTSTSGNTGGNTGGSGNIQLLSNINTFASASANMDFEYTDSQYSVEEDHVFEFDASEIAGYVDYAAFKVYVSEDNMEKDIQSMKDVGYHTEGYFCESHYENGKIRVSPSGAPKLTEIGSSNEDGDIPTWGSLNRLFLAQWIDLETGEELEKPIVTIFSVKHKLDAPIVSQTLDENNNYTLTWNAVTGATDYSVYVMLDDASFAYEGTTSETSITCRELESEKNILSMVDTITMEDTGCVFGMNYHVERYADEDYKFVVVAKNGDKESGISNLVSPKDIAGAVPYTTPSETPEINITKAIDAPMYMGVIMADETEKEMMVDYHGAHIYEQEDGSIYVSAKYLNTNMACTFKLTGIPYEEFRDGAEEIKARQDGANITNTTIDVDNRVSQVPNSEEEQNAEEAKQRIEKLGLNEEEIESAEPDKDEPTEAEPIETPEEPTEDPTEKEEAPTEKEEPTEAKPVDTTEPIDTPESTKSAEPIETPTEVEEVVTEVITEPVTEVNHNTPNINTNSSNEMYNAVLVKIESIYNEHGINVDDLSKVIYADSQLEAYLAYALTARLDVIPVPTEVFPEATNVDYLAKLFVEAYRQNPTSGIMCDLRYSYDDEALLVSYADDTNDRLNKTAQELSKAKELSVNLTKDATSELDKVYAINQYFCDNASYDFDSMATDVDLTSLSQPFIDAHTPYGILCNNYGVCESYSEAFALTGRFAGFNIIMETGYLNGGAHEWNKVQLGDNWYIADITNNDMNIAKNTLLLVSEEQAKILSGDNGAYTFDAVASDESKEYYKNTTGLMEDTQDAVKAISEQLDSKDVAAVRFSYDIEEDEAMSILQEVYNKGYELDRYELFNNVLGVSK